MKKALLISLFSVFSLVSQAQYDNAIGLRGLFSGIGGGVGVTGKTTLGDGNYIEGIVGLPGGVIDVTALWEPHLDLSAPGLRWYYGLGAHVWLGNNALGLGPNAILGIEYNFGEIPLNLSLDAIPTIDFNTTDEVGFIYFSSGLSARYTF